MQEPAFDVIVVGLGAVGSAALHQLSKSGARVAGFDSFSPPHNQGSSHGQTRLTRQAIGEGPSYTPLALRSNEIWRELEQKSGHHLLVQNGGLIYGRTDSRTQVHGVDDFLENTIRQAREHGITHEVLDFRELKQRFPQLRFHDNDVGYFEPGAGYLFPEDCIRTQLNEAKRNGARLFLDEQVQRLKIEDDVGSVLTHNGSWSARQIILAAGRWIREFMPPTRRSLFEVYPQVLGWYALKNSQLDLTPPAMPVFVRLPSAGESVVYGFPAMDGDAGLIKVATEQFEATGSPDRMPEAFHQELRERLQKAAEQALEVTPSPTRTQACAYTVTPDSHFIIDQHPEHPNVLIASACSGHGFKHSAAVGELIAEWAATGAIPEQLRPFSFNRFRP